VPNQTDAYRDKG